MKSVFSFLMLAFLVFSCQPSADENNNIPESIADKRALLKEKQSTLKTLADEIEALEAAIIEQDPSSRKKGTLVSISEVERNNFERFIKLQGSVAADDLYDATSEIAGRILSLTVKEGSSVRKGQVVATLDVESIQKQRAELETSLDLANIVFERQDRLWKQKIGSEMQFLQAKNNKERLEKSLATVDLQLSKNKVYAPSNGVVERLILQAGELASPGMPIVQILNMNQLKVVADVPENYIKSINKGDRVAVNVLALDMEKTLPVSLIGKTVDPANRTFKVEVKLPSNPLLKPNLLAEVKIKEFATENVVSIALDKIQQEVGGERFVYIAQQTDQGLIAKKTYIQIGDSYEGQIIITEGLKGGETLIMEGSRGLSDGQSIEITQNKAN